MINLFKLFTIGLKVTSILLAPKKIAYLIVGAQHCLFRGNNFKLGLGFHIDPLYVLLCIQMFLKDTLSVKQNIRSFGYSIFLKRMKEGVQKAKV